MLALNLSACTDIQDGTTDIDSWPAINEYTLNHPCMLHTDADFTYVKSKLTRTPWSEGLDKLKIRDILILIILLKHKKS